MKRFVEGEDRRQGVLLPEYLDDWMSEENPVRAIDDRRCAGMAISSSRKPNIFRRPRGERRGDR